MQVNYTWESGLGVGGFGAVISAVNNRTRIKCALKIVSTVQGEAEVLKELGILTALRHKNVVRLDAAWKEAVDSSTIQRIKTYLPKIPDSFKIPFGYAAIPVVCMEMELCRGDLRNYLKDPKTASLDTERFRILTDIINGIRYIHSQSVIHRDLKPENIFIDRQHSDVAKIGDVGLAKFAGINGTTGTPYAVSKLQQSYGLGTPRYCAPEQMNSNSYGRTADIYPLGIIFFELYWPNANLGHVSQWVNLLNDLTKKSRLPQLFNARFRQLVLQMVSSRAEQRPSAQDILANITRFECDVCKNIITVARYSCQGGCGHFDVCISCFQQGKSCRIQGHSYEKVNI